MDLESRLIKLGASRKDLRPHIRPVLAEIRSAKSYASASDKYEDMRKQIDQQIKTLEKNVHRYDQKNGRNPDWGNANDLGRVLDLLEQINRFM